MGKKKVVSIVQRMSRAFVAPVQQEGFRAMMDFPMNDPLCSIEEFLREFLGLGECGSGRILTEEISAPLQGVVCEQTKKPMVLASEHKQKIKPRQGSMWDVLGMEIDPDSDSDMDEPYSEEESDEEAPIKICEATQPPASPTPKSPVTPPTPRPTLCPINFYPPIKSSQKSNLNGSAKAFQPTNFDGGETSLFVSPPPTPSPSSMSPPPPPPPPPSFSVPTPAFDCHGQLEGTSEPKVWACSTCTFNNSAHMPSCEMCGTFSIDIHRSKVTVATATQATATAKVLTLARGTGTCKVETVSSIQCIEQVHSHEGQDGHPARDCRSTEKPNYTETAPLLMTSTSISTGTRACLRDFGSIASAPSAVAPEMHVEDTDVGFVRGLYSTKHQGPYEKAASYLCRCFMAADISQFV
jgi:hypothetical protein